MVPKKRDPAGIGEADAAKDKFVQSKRSMIQVYMVSMILLAIVPTLLMGYLWVSEQYDRFETQSSERRDRYIDTRKKILQQSVASTLDYIDYEKSRVERRTRKNLKSRVDDAYALAGTLNREHAGDTLGLLADALSPIRFNQGAAGYLLVDGQGKLLLGEEIFGHSVSGQGVSDQRAAGIGEYNLRDAIALAKKVGSGFITIQTTKPGETTQSACLLHVRYYPALDLVLAAGEYVEDTQQEVKQSVIARLARAKFNAHTAVPFISDFDGVQLVRPDNPAAVGQKFSEFGDAESGEPLIIEHLQAALSEEGGFIEYQFQDPIGFGVTPAVNFVRGYPEWRWMVGAGFFLKHLEEQIAEERGLLEAKVRGLMQRVGIIVIALVLVAVATARGLARQSSRGFNSFANFFRAASYETDYISEEHLPYSEFSELADSANRMIDERSRYEEALRVSEQRSELALQHSRHFLWDIYLKSGQILFSGDFFGELGYGSEDFDPTRVESIFSICHPDDRQQIIDAMDGSMTESSDLEYRLLDADDNYRWFFSRGGPVEFDDAGLVSRVLGIVTDITDRKEIENELVTARVSAEDANHAKNLFLSSMSHELRTPLNGVLGYAQILLRDEELSKEQRQYLSSISDCGQHLLELINDILELSRIESDNIEVRETNCQLREILQDIDDIIRKKAESKGLDYEVTMDPGLPSALCTDKTKLKQILVNLLANAVKFTGEGSVQMKIGQGVSSEHIQFHIIDSGVGIAQENINDIFEPFKQLRGIDTDGTGLGLTICNRLAHALEGDINVRSDLGSGSRFTLTIPLKSVEAKPVHCVGRFEPVVISPTNKRTTILIADDNEANRKVLAGMLSRLGVETIEAKDGGEVIALLGARPVDAVLMDIHMPVMDGLTATAAIRRDPALLNTVVIAVSASVFDQDIEEMMLAGCDDFIGKPVSADDLVMKLSSHLPINFKTSEPFAQGVVQIEDRASSSLSKSVLYGISKQQLDNMREALGVGDIDTLRLSLESIEKTLRDKQHLSSHEWLVRYHQLLDQFDLEGVSQLLDEINSEQSVVGQ